jgi:anti-anti-sigma factor
MADASKVVRQVREESNATVVVLAGDVDLHHTPEVHKALVEACKRQPAWLVINLEGVAYMDSSGIGTLVEVFRRVNGYGGTLALCGLNDRVMSVFEITRLDKFFKIFATEQEALSA